MGRRRAPSSVLGPWPKTLARGHSLAPGKYEIGVPGGACPVGACPIPARWVTPTSNRKHRVPMTALVCGAGRRDPSFDGAALCAVKWFGPMAKPWPGAIHLPRARVRSRSPAGRAPLGPAPSPHGGQRRLLKIKKAPVSSEDTGAFFGLLTGKKGGVPAWPRFAEMPLSMEKAGQIEAKISGQCKQTRQAESRQH